MADVRISELPSAAALSGTEELPVVQSATTTKTTVNDIVAKAPVQSVAGKTGIVTLTPSDAGAEPADATILKSASIGVTVQGYNANTVVDPSYVHTDNNYTTAEQSKLAGIETGAEVNVNADWNATSGDARILNKPTLGTAAATASTDYATAAQGILAGSAVQPAAIANMLETSDIGVTVQGYSSVLDGTTASFTTADETKLDGIATGAEVNVNADWNATSGDARILNKPLIPSRTSDITNDSGFITSYTETDPVVGAVSGIVKANGSGTIGAVVSGTDIKTINGTSLLGSGDITISGGGSGGGISSADIQEFTSAGTSTWTKPSGAKLVHVLLFGGGGGGGSGRRRAIASLATAAAGGSGGGAGGRLEYWLPASVLASTETVTVGAGSTGGAAATVDDTGGTSAAAGGNSSFGVFALVRGGIGGTGGISSAIAGGNAGNSYSETVAGTAVAAATGGQGSVTGAGGNASAGGFRAGGGGGASGFNGNSILSQPGGTGGLGGNFLTTSILNIGGGGAGGISGAAGGSGANGIDSTNYFVGGSGGGGGANGTISTGGGGSGGYPSGAGGGGGAGHGVDSGSGGNGGNGYVRVTTFF